MRLSWINVFILLSAALSLSSTPIPKQTQNLAVGRSESSRGSIDRKARCIDDAASFAIVESQGLGSVYGQFLNLFRYNP